MRSRRERATWQIRPNIERQQRAMAKKKLGRAGYLHEVFSGNDQLKANPAQSFKSKGVLSFKMV